MHNSIYAKTFASTLIILFVASVGRGADVTSTFVPSSGLWSLNANWSNSPVSGGFPNNGNAGVSTYDAVVNGADVRLDQSITLQKLTFSGGTIWSNFNLIANDLVIWNGGSIEGAATFLANGGMSLGGVVEKSLSNGRILNNSGSATWTSGLFRLFSGSTVNNGGTFVASNATVLTLSPALGGSNVFYNPGTYIKRGTGTNTIAVSFHNSGTVDVQAGRLELNGSGDHTGQFLGAGTVEFGLGVHRIISPAGVSAAGVEFTGAFVTNSGTYTVKATGLRSGAAIFTGPAVATSGTLDFTGGTLGGAGSLTVTGLTVWNAGTMEGTGVTLANGGMMLGGAGQKVLEAGRVLANPASTLWTNGQVRLFSGSTLNNSGTFTAASASRLDMNQALGGANVFNNNGTYVKQGAGTNDVSVVFNNPGVVNVQAGHLSLNGGGNSSGRFEGNSLEFGGGVHILSGASTVSVAQVLVTLGAVTNSGRYDVTNGTTASSGFMRLAPASSVGSVGLLTLRGGTIDFSSGDPINTSSLNISGGTLGGTDTVTVSGMTVWTGGTMDNQAITHANGGMLLGGPNQKVLEGGRILNNPASALWTNGQIRLFSGSTWNNSGTFTAASASRLDMNQALGGTNAFNNTGAYVKQGIGTNGIAAIFNNNGVLDIQAGHVELNSGGNSSGLFTGPGNLEFGGGAHNLSGSSTVTVAQVFFTLGTVTNNGRYDVAGGTTSSSGVARFTPASSVGSVGPLAITGGTIDFSSGDQINSSSLTLSGGTLGGPDAVTISGLVLWTGGTMDTGITHANGGVLLAGPLQKVLEGGRVLNNTGAALWTNGQLRLFRGSTWNNPGTFTAASDARLDLNQALGGVNAFNNSGSYLKQGTGTNAVATLLNNNGLLDIQAGRVELSGGGNSSGLFTGPGALEFGGGTHVLSSSSTVNVAQVFFTLGAVTNNGRYDVTGGTTSSGGVAHFASASSVGSVGPLKISGGTIDFSSGDPINSSTLDLSDGTLGGTDTVTITGNTVWIGGTMEDTGTTIAVGGLVLGSSSFKTLQGGRVLSNPTSATWTNGLLRIFSGSTFNNGGTFTVSSADRLEISRGLGGSNSFNNNGLYSKTGTGSNEVAVSFNNAGTVLAAQGILEFSGGYRQTAGSTVVTGGTVWATSPLDIRGGTLAGSGVVTGTVTNNGTLAPGFAGAGNLQIGTLVCGSNSLLAIELGGATQGTQYDYIQLNNAVTLAGTLDVKFISGFQASISSNTTFTIVTAVTSLGGGFANVASGERIYTSDGFGSFRVNYSPVTKAVVLSEFEPILPVVADFTSNPQNGPAPLNVAFVNLTAGSATNFTWTFGDGGSSSLANPSHVYNNIGSYTVSLTASGPGGTNSITKTNFITASQPTCSLLVLNTDDSGPGSLRAAIACANTNAGVDTITFNIPGAGVHTIDLLTPLPQIVDRVVIDGYSQPGSSLNTLTNGNNAVLQIELNGASVSNGLLITAGQSILRGLVLNRFNSPDAAIVLSSGAGNVIEGNFIGTDATGNSPLGNSGSGILITSGSISNLIGGPTPGAANIIAYNAGSGVRVDENGSAAVWGNSLFNNAGLGIDLIPQGGVPGVTANDGNDSDRGGNQLQNYPVLTVVTNSGGVTTIQGTLNSTPLNSFRIEFFSNTTCDTNGFGEGRTLLGVTNVTTAGDGNAAFSFTAPSLGGNVYTATATDTNNNTSEFAACISPVTGCNLVCPPNIVVTNTLDQCGAIVSYPAPQGTGDCGTIISLPPSGSFFPIGTTTVNCTASNGGTCSFLVTVLDRQAPVIICPTNLVLTTSPGVCFLTNFKYNIFFGDNCPGENVLQTSGLPSGADFPKGTTTNSWTATDASGNTTSCSFTVTIVDSELPTIVCPANLVRSTDPGQCTASNVSYAATANDNCPGVSVAYTPPPGSSFPKGVTTVTCIATDTSGNSNSCVFSVTVNDTQPPAIACPADMIVSTSPGLCVATNVVFSPAGTDNCPGVSVTSDPPSGSTFVKGTNLVTWVATDIAGNSNSCVFSVIVRDTQPPTITCPPSVVVTAGQDEPNVIINFQPPTGTDNCPGVSFAATPPSGSSFPVGTTQVRCVATDAAGNTNSCTFLVMVNSPEAPKADLVLTKSGSPSSIAVGSELTYSLVVSNAGPDLAANVAVLDELPTLVSFVSAESDFGTCTLVGNNVVCELGTLAEGDAATVVIKVVPTGASTICNFASVQSDQIDLVLSNNTASVCTLVTSPPAGADLSVTMIDSPDPVRVGTNFTYSIRVRNNGPQGATGVVLTDTLQAGLTVVSIPTNSTLQGNTLTCQIGSLTAGASVMRNIVVSAAAPGAVCNLAAVTCDQVDPVTANNADTACTEITSTQQQVHDLAVIKITAPPNVNLTASKPVQTRYVTVQIQNRSPHNETISSFSGFGTNLVTLRVESLGICPDLTPHLRVGSPQKALPVILKPKQKLNVLFDVTFTSECISDPRKTSKTAPGHEDYRYFAMVHHEAIDGHPDTHPEDDYGPRSANPPFETDPNPDGTIKDTGVGKKKGDNTFGADIVTDVVRK